MTTDEGLYRLTMNQSIGLVPPDDNTELILGCRLQYCVFKEHTIYPCFKDLLTRCVLALSPTFISLLHERGYTWVN